jgi:hypothetical protein
LIKQRVKAANNEREELEWRKLNTDIISKELEDQTSLKVMLLKNKKTVAACTSTSTSFHYHHHTEL